MEREAELVEILQEINEQLRECERLARETQATLTRIARALADERGERPLRIVK